MRSPREPAEVVRGRILDAAEEALAASGEAGVTMRSLATKVGYSVPVLYQHFADREAILAATLGRAMGRFGERLAEAEQLPGTPVDKLVRVGRAYLDFAAEERTAYRMMFVDRPSWAEVPAAAEVGNQPDAFDVLQRTIRAAVDAPEQELRALADVLWAGVHGLATLRWTPAMPEARAPAAIDAWFALVRTALAARSEVRGSDPLPAAVEP